jgi:hypothetical protein
VTYRDLNPVKFAFLLARGTHDGELRRFFSETQRQLIMRQARVQNLPNGRDNRVKMLSEKLPRTTDEVVRNWFATNLTMIDLIPLDEVISDLSLYDQVGEPIPDEQAKRLARSALVHLFAKEPAPAELVDFLKRRPGGEEAHPAPKSSDQPNATDQATRSDRIQTSELPSELGEADAQLESLVWAVMMGDEPAIDEALGPLSQRLQTLVNALSSIKSGDVARAAALAETLEPKSHAAKLVQRAMTLARHKPGKFDSTVPGLHVKVPQLLEPFDQVSVLDVIAAFSAQTDKVVFLRPLAIVIDQSVRRLTSEDRARMFPESGDVMSYREPGRHLPRPGELVRWIVEEREIPSGRTRFHYVKEPSPVVEVISIPFPSSAPDEVRAHIKQVMTDRQSTNPQPLFALADGVSIWPPRGSDPRRDESYQQSWQAWGSLDVWVIDGRQYCLGVPPLPSSSLDLSPLDAAFKKLVKNIVDEQALQFTKSQLRVLSSLIRAQDLGDVALRATRVADAIDQIGIDADSIEALLPILVKKEEIQSRVESVVSEQVAEKLKEKAGIAVEVEAMRGRLGELQRESKELDKKIKKQGLDVESAVRETFSRAVQDGVRTLAEAEAFRFLLSGGQNKSEAGKSAECGLDLKFSMGSDSLSSAGGISTLVKLGLGRRRAELLVELTAVLKRSGCCLILRGRDSREYAKVLGRMDCHSYGFLEVPMGLVSSSPVAKAIKQAGRLDSIVVLGANISPLEVYGAPIFDELVESALNDDPSASYRVVMSCIDGDLAIPIAKSIRRFAILVDVDSSWEYAERSLDELDEHDIPLMKPASVKLTANVQNLDPAVRRRVEALIVDAFSRLES